jgi:hypothetical protein
MLSNDLPIKFLKDGLCNFTPPNVDQDSSALSGGCFTVWLGLPFFRRLLSGLVLVGFVGRSR